MKVTSNFTSIFAQYSDIEDLKAIANEICTQVKEAYTARTLEITKVKKQTSVKVEVAVDTPAPKAAEKKSKADAAKEAAKKIKAEKKTEKSVKAEKKKANAKDSDLVAITDTAAIKELGLTFTKYNDKCWVLRGNTKPLRKILKEEFKGVFNDRLSGGEGWIFRTARAAECAKALGMEVEVA